MMVGGGGGGGLGFDYYSSPGFGFEAPWVPPPYDPYISFGLFPGSRQSYLMATGMWELVEYNDITSFIMQHIVLDMEEGTIDVGAAAASGELFYEDIAKCELTDGEFNLVMEAFRMMYYYGGEEGRETFFTLLIGGVKISAFDSDKYVSSGRLLLGITSNDRRAIALNFVDIGDLSKKYWAPNKGGSTLGSLTYTLAHEGWHVREGLHEVKGFWELSQFFYTMGSTYEIMTTGGWITHGDAADYGWDVYFAIAANRYGGRIW